MLETILLKATENRFDMMDGRTITLPKNYVMAHDEDGKGKLPKNVIFFVPASWSNQRIENPPRNAKAYFGDDYDLHHAGVDIPISTGQWKREGAVRTFWYARPGAHAATYFHHISQPSWFERFMRKLFGFPPPKDRAVLYKNGRAYALALPKNAVVNWRGIVWP